MPDVTANLSNDDIATLSDIAESEAARNSSREKPLREASVEKLLALGFVEPAAKAAQYKTTRKGQDFMSSRGAGLNEA